MVLPTDPLASTPGVAPGSPVAIVATRERRCGCGSLLARLLPGGVELKCRRCKQVVMLTFAQLAAGEVASH